MIAKPLHDHPVDLRPAPDRRDRPDGSGALFNDPTVQAATRQGWDLLCPYSFEATWTGGTAPTDVVISEPGFALSEVGHGVLTLQTGYQVELQPEHNLWIRGPANHPKDGIAAIEQVVEADLLPVHLAVNWRFTRPGQVVRFERGEPFATLLPMPQQLVGQLSLSIDELLPIDLPGVSCICPTYGRPALLEEAIESFLRQDYRGPKELVILNDYPDQTLDVRHPEVRVINVPHRFRTLGEKLNTLVGLADYDLIAVWTDDDISLPHRLSLSVDRFDRRAGFFKASRAFFWNSGTISGPERNVFHGGSLWSRDLFGAVRGYAHRTHGCDQTVEQAFAAARLDGATATELSRDETYFIYRWGGTDSYHVSAAAQGRPDPEDAYAVVKEYVAARAQAGEIPTGAIQLVPRWHRDYLADVLSFLEQPESTEAAVAVASPVPGPVEDESLPIVFGSLPRPVPEAEALALFDGSQPRRITVVIPACNEVRFLERTVRQFEATLPPNSEIIVVDNGSTDGTGSFLADLSTLPPSDRPVPRECGNAHGGVSIKLVRHRAQLGVAGARNRGLDHATGEVVVFSDAHNDVPPGWWPPVVRTLRIPRVGIVGPAFGILGQESSATSCGQRIADTSLRVEWLPFRQIEPHPVPTLGGGFMALRRHVLDTVGPFDDGLPQWGSEDLEICLRLWSLGYEVWVVPEVEIPHFFRSQSPYDVQTVHVLHNQIRTAILHLSEERVAHVLHALMKQQHFARAMARCMASDVWERRAALHARRVHDDDWLFNHPYFQDITMELRGERSPVRA